MLVDSFSRIERGHFDSPRLAGTKKKTLDECGLLDVCHPPIATGYCAAAQIRDVPISEAIATRPRCSIPLTSLPPRKHFS